LQCGARSRGRGPWPLRQPESGASEAPRLEQGYQIAASVLAGQTEGGLDGVGDGPRVGAPFASPDATLRKIQALEAQIRGARTPTGKLAECSVSTVARSQLESPILARVW
jgi:hypothetical protein